MDASERVSDRYNDIIEGCKETGRPTGFPEADRIIYYVVSTRCDIDIGGFARSLGWTLESRLDA